MSRLLNALLNISKLESGAVKPNPSDFAVSALFEELRLEFAALADSKGLLFKVTPSTDWVHSDRSLVEQVLKNHGQAVHPSPRTGTETGVSSVSGKARLLLVEDDPGVRNATRMLLNSEGYQVTAVASLVEALAHAAKDPRLDLLVTDYHLEHGETGMQVIEALRAALRVPLRALLITGDTSSAVSELPVDAHLRIASKPIDAAQLLAMLRELLSN
jgi:CheY-like chemotaxis protein